MSSVIAIGKPRLASEAEAEAVHASLWAARHDIPLTERFITRPYLDHIQEHCRAGRVWVVASDGAIAGAMLLEIEKISYLVVAEAYRRLGVARQLIATAKKRYRSLTGEAAPENARVIALPQREGFCHVGDKPSADGARTWSQFHWQRGR